MSLAGVRALWTVSSQSVRLENTCLELDFSLMQFQLVCCEQILIFFLFTSSGVSDVLLCTSSRCSDGHYLQKVVKLNYFFNQIFLGKL